MNSTVKNTALRSREHAQLTQRRERLSWLLLLSVAVAPRPGGNVCPWFPTCYKFISVAAGLCLFDPYARFAKSTLARTAARGIGSVLSATVFGRAKLLQIRPSKDANEECPTFRSQLTPQAPLQVAVEHPLSSHGGIPGWMGGSASPLNFGPKPSAL